jgi:Leucine-rich repeat (LRR) protein
MHRNLQHNQLESVDGQMFSHLSELHTLDMQGNGCSGRFLSYLQNCRNLTSLRLSGNNIRSLPPDGLHLPSLQLLYLSNNLITELPPHLFTNTHNITKLELKNNLITTLPKTLFTHTTVLKGIFFQNNSISHLKEGVFMNLHKLEGM